MKVLSSMALGAVVLTVAASSALAAPVVASVDLNMRSGPGTRYPVIAVILRGDTADASDCAAGWCRVVYRGQMGWASEAYLSGAPQDYTYDYGGPYYTWPWYNNYYFGSYGYYWPYYNNYYYNRNYYYGYHHRYPYGMRPGGGYYRPGHSWTPGRPGTGGAIGGHYGGGAHFGGGGARFGGGGAHFGGGGAHFGGGGHGGGMRAH
jgi:hypothetical protein